MELQFRASRKYFFKCFWNRIVKVGVIGTQRKSACPARILDIKTSYIFYSKCVCMSIFQVVSVCGWLCACACVLLVYLQRKIVCLPIYDKYKISSTLIINRFIQNKWVTYIMTKCRCYKTNKTLKLFDKSWRYPVAKYIKQFALWNTVTIGYGQISPEFNRNRRMT